MFLHKICFKFLACLKDTDGGLGNILAKFGSAKRIKCTSFNHLGLCGLYVMINVGLNWGLD